MPRSVASPTARNRQGRFALDCRPASTAAHAPTRRTAVDTTYFILLCWARLSKRGAGATILTVAVAAIAPSGELSVKQGPLQRGSVGHCRTGRALASAPDA